MDRLLDKTVDFLYKNGSVSDKDDIEIVRYGLEILYIKIFFSISTMIIGLFMNSFFECLVFNIFFSGIRSFTGGYHAVTRKKCFFESMATFSGVLILFKLIATYSFLYNYLIILYMLSVVIVFRFAPIDTENKRIDEREFNSFRKKSRISVLSEMIIALISWVH